METEKSNAHGVIIDGVEYINQQQAAKMVGHSVFSFVRKVEKFQIEKIKRQSGRVLYRTEDILNGIEKGWFKKWYV